MPGRPAHPPQASTLAATGAVRGPGPVPVVGAGRASAGGGGEETMRIEWFDDLALGMRFKISETVITREDIKRLLPNMILNPVIAMT